MEINYSQSRYCSGALALHVVYESIGRFGIVSGKLLQLCLVQRVDLNNAVRNVVLINIAAHLVAEWTHLKQIQHNLRNRR